MIPSVKNIAAIRIANKAVQQQLNRATRTVEKRRRRKNMALRSHGLPLAAAGVVAMYFFDPATGSQRRAALKQRLQTLRASNEAKVQDLRDKSEDKVSESKDAKDRTARLVTDKLRTEAPVNQ